MNTVCKGKSKGDPREPWKSLLYSSKVIIAGGWFSITLGSYPSKPVQIRGSATNTSVVQWQNKGLIFLMSLVRSQPLVPALLKIVLDFHLKVLYNSWCKDGIASSRITTAMWPMREFLHTRARKSPTMQARVSRCRWRSEGLRCQWNGN